MHFWAESGVVFMRMRTVKATVSLVMAMVLCFGDNYF
jgi:hypothetical protein